MAIKYEEYGINEIFKKNQEKKLVLPNFQRGFVWKIEKQKRMISSFLVSVPIGSLLLLEGKSDDFAARDLCLTESVSPARDCHYILDGQQRLSTLKTALSDIFNTFNTKQDPYEKLYNQLKHRWFIRIVPDEKEEDVFGIRDFTTPKLDKLEPDDLVDFILPIKIYKKYENESHHPHYILQDNGEYAIETNQGRQNLANIWAQNNIIPLFELSKKEYGIHREVLENIAMLRSKELRAKIKDEVPEAKHVFFTHGKKEEDIETLIDDEGFWQGIIHKWINRIAFYLEKLTDNKIPVIELPQEEINRAVAIFEQLNEGGTPLNVFDLIVAKSAREAAEDSSLSEKICKIDTEGIKLPTYINRDELWSSSAMDTIDNNNLSKVYQDVFLNNLSLTINIKKNLKYPQIDFIKKSGILRLTSCEINKYYQNSVIAINRALFFLQNRCGIFSCQNISYKLMIQPIAFVFNDDTMWESEKIHNLLEYWYWVSLFGGAYREKQNERCINDISYIYNGVYNNEISSFLRRLEEKENFIFEYQNYSDKNTLLNQNEDVSTPTAIENGIRQYVLRREPQDILKQEVNITAEKISTGDIEVEVHHFIPLANASNLSISARNLRSNSYKKHILNSPLNLIYILKSSNARLRDFSPDVYINDIKNKNLAGLFLSSGTELIKQHDENNESYYYRVLSSRYELIKNDMHNHIRRLKNNSILNE